MTERFKYTVSLTHVASGETVEFQEAYSGDHKTPDTEWENSRAFWWEEGNGSCNCNRDIWFRKETGKPPLDLEDDDKECSEYDAYRVNWIRNDQTGNIFYEEKA